MAISIDYLWKKLAELQENLPFLGDFFIDFPEAEIYLVGGAVRDLLWQRETKDYDFLIRGVSAKKLGDFLRQHGKVSWVGKNFGVYKFIPHLKPFAEAIDIALPRTESSFSQGGGYRDFEIVSDPELPVEEDLKRRDFTINAMAADLKQKNLIDPFEGLKDLEAGLIRTVGDPGLRFSEDSSRLLRGLRFVSQFDFSFEKETWATLKQLIFGLSALREDGTPVVPRETIAKEFIKAMVLHPVRAFDLWDESGAFAVLIPELLAMKNCPQPENHHSEGDVWIHTRLALSQLLSLEFKAEFEQPLNAEIVLAVLFHDIAKPLTIQTPEKDGTDRIRFHQHDTLGAKMTRKIVNRLKLSSYPKESQYYVNEDGLAWLVEKHLILVQGQIEQMRAATIERHFLSPNRPGATLLQLIYCDGMATVPKNPKNHQLHYWAMKDRILKIEALALEQAKIPAPLLGGREVMTVANITSGRAVGQYLALIREEQLNGRISSTQEAIIFLKKQIKNNVL
ncbi:MAG: CCA tRNA nucleotidyltransferase [Nitrospirae bacterium]|nr:CCA tRNA nucleotidyltransferase [Candidatus Manganitrophaceae bacterium]